MCKNISYDSQEKIDQHIKSYNLPEKEKVDRNGNREDILKFKNYGNSFAHPFSVYLDFESTLINPKTRWKK